MKFIVTLLLILSVVLVGCKGDTTTVNRFDPFQGTQGISLELLDNAPPRDVFEGDTFNVVVNLHNKGAYSVVGEESVFFELILDQYYFVPSNPEDSLKTTARIGGKTRSNHNGDYEIRDFLIKANELEGQRESPTSTILFSVCYPYQTNLSEDVCLDSDPFDTDVRDKSCTAKPITLSGQGAPIAITRIEPRMPVKVIGDIPRVAPSFAITVKNLGDGNVILRDPARSISDNCVVKNTNTQLWGYTSLSAHLANHNLTCFPNKLRFINNEAVTTCKINNDQEGFIPLTFKTQPEVLSVSLDYIYVQGDHKEITIHRSASLQ